jgi:hypothetical protein
MHILDNIIFKERIQDYYSNRKALSRSKIYNYVNVDSVKIVDDYTEKEQQVFEFNDVKFKVTHEAPNSFTVNPVALTKDNKIINISHKAFSYFALLDYYLDHQQIIENSNDLLNNNNFEYIEEEVFMFFDCFPYAAVHNTDDMYNLLYFYKKNNLKCKLLVLKTDNFFYNQTIESLKNVFKLEYIYLDLGKKYIFKNFKCTRQYHWIQDEALKFIKDKYIKKICDEFNHEKKDNVSLLKIMENENASNWDYVHVTDKFKLHMQKENFYDLNLLKNDLHKKIYLINNSKKILITYLSPFNINVYKHCIDYSDKIINIIHPSNSHNSPIYEQFKIIDGCTYEYYGLKINAKIFDNISNLDVILEEI